MMRPNKRVDIFINLETKGKNLVLPTEKNSTGLVMDKSMCINEGKLFNLILGYLIIYNSELVCGKVDKSIVGDGSKNSLFYVALRDYGPACAADYMNKTAKLSARWMGNQGFSIGIDDVQASAALQKEKSLVVESGYIHISLKFLDSPNVMI
jgi:DNA-directed RNA polymerase III subunit RPC1